MKTDIYYIQLIESIVSRRNEYIDKDIFNRRNKMLKNVFFNLEDALIVRKGLINLLNTNDSNLIIINKKISNSRIIRTKITADLMHRTKKFRDRKTFYET